MNNDDECVTSIYSLKSERSAWYDECSYRQAADESERESDVLLLLVCVVGRSFGTVA